MSQNDPSGNDPTSPHGQGGPPNPYGQNPYGAQNPYGGQNPYGAQNPYGQDPYGGQNPYGGQSPYSGSKIRGPRPRSVNLAITLIWAGVVVGLLGALVQFFFLDDLIAAQQAAQPAGSPELSDDVVRTAAIIGLVIGLAISVGFAVLAVFLLGKGYNWARIVYTVLSVLGLLFSVVSLFSAPVLQVLFGLVGIGLTIAVLVLLYRPDSNAWFAGRA